MIESCRFWKLSLGQGTQRPHNARANAWPIISDQCDPYPRRTFISLMIALLGCSAFIDSASAELSESFRFLGNGNWALDAVGSRNTGAIGPLTVRIPVGSQIEQAFLYSTKSYETTPPSVTIDGHSFLPTDFTSLGVVHQFGQPLAGFRADATEFVRSRITPTAQLHTFFVQVEVTSRRIEGEALVVIYSHPEEQLRSIVLHDGFVPLDDDGDRISIDLARTPVLSTAMGADTSLSLGISFSYQLDAARPQATYVDIGTNRLTSSAGGGDDGVDTPASDGGSITIGGHGDSIANPADPFSSPNGNPRYDDELYNLVPLMAPGQRELDIWIRIPIKDDHIFFVGVNSVVTPEPSMGTLVIAATTCLLIRRVYRAGIRATSRGPA